MLTQLLLQFLLLMPVHKAHQAPGFSGSGVPASSLGANGDYYFRTDTPSVANQRIYVKSAGAWLGIL
jgi:hypothetical protein